MSAPQAEQQAATSAEKLQARALESDLFGGTEGLVSHIVDDGALDGEEAEAEYSVAAYARDASAVDGVTAQQDVSTVKLVTKASRDRHKRKPAWVDAEDAETAVDVAAVPRLRKLRKADTETVLTGSAFEQRLRGQHKKLNPGTAWAEPQHGSHRDPDALGEEEPLAAEAFTRHLSHLTDKGRQLPAGRVELTRVRDANLHERSKGVVQSVEFHPNGQLLMTAGLDKRLAFFHADGVRNPVVQTMFLEDMPVHTARFAAGGALAVASGRRRFFYVLDLEHQALERVKGVQGREERSLEAFAVPPAAAPADQRACIAFLGNEGAVTLVSLRTRQWVGELKVNGAVRSAAFSPDGRHIYTGGTDGQVYLWDVRMRRCVHRLRDEGAVRSTCLAVGDGVFAAGADSGVVNVYGGLHGAGDGRGAGSAEPGLPAPPAAAKPLRALGNLVTAVDTLTFSPDSQLLCMASRLKKDALRLVHVPSLTTFANWPTGRSPLHYVHCATFSPGGGFLAVGNAKGHVLLYRLHHYPTI